MPPHNCSTCVVCLTEPATHMALPCRHFSYCSKCIEDVNQCVAMVTNQKCNQAIMVKQRIFQVHPNDECPCSRCTICMEHDAIYAKIPNGSLELCGDCVDQMLHQTSFPISNLNLGKGDTKLLAKIIRTPIDDPASHSFPDYLKVEHESGGMCHLLKTGYGPGIIFEAIGADMKYLDNNRNALDWEKMDVNGLIDQDGNSMLHLACEKGYTELVEKLLLVPWIIVDRPNRYGATALFFASANNHYSIVKMLIEQTVLALLMSKSNQIDTLEIMLYYNRDPKKVHPTVVYQNFFDRKNGGSFRPQMNPFTYIHNNNGSTRYPLGSTAFSIAQSNHNYEIVGLLKKSFPNENQNIKTILKSEVQPGHTDAGMDYTDSKMFTAISEVVRVTQNTTMLLKKDTQIFYGHEKMVLYSCCTPPGHEKKGCIIYGKDGKRRRYFGELEVSTTLNQEVPHGYGLLVYNDGTYDMGQFSMDVFVPTDVPLSMTLKNLARRFF